jgi:hypothetical protein
MSKITDVNKVVNKTNSHVNKNVNKEFLGVQEIATRAGVHPNTVRNKCLEENPDLKYIKVDGKKKVIEVEYASSRLGVDVNILLTKKSSHVNKSFDGIDVNKKGSDVNILLTNAKDEVISNLKEENKSLKDQLAMKDSQINALLSELSDSRNQSNVILKNIQDNFLPLIDSQQRLLESREDNDKKKSWWPFKS